MTNRAPCHGAPLSHRNVGEVVHHIYDAAPRAAIQSRLAFALDYAARGFAVFPCLETSKAPAVGRGFHSATTNPATIRRWFLNCPQYNLAIATGIASGAWVLDVDGSDGAQSLLELEDQFGALPNTLTSSTASGCHFWFRLTDPMPSSVGRIARGLDVRADGGYVLAPPSEHPDGPIYRWTNACDRAIAPKWLMERAYKKVVAPRLVPSINRAGSSNYGRAALNDECRALASAFIGTRNHALNRASFTLHQLVAGGELDIAEVRNGLIAAATANGLIDDDGPRQVEKTIASGARAGLQNPRSRPA
jgi:hypothetical protein